MALNLNPRANTALRLALWLTAFLLIGLAVNLNELAGSRSQLTTEKERALRNLVDSARSLVEALHAQQLNGTLTETEAQHRAIESLRTMRYRKVEYFWIHNTEAPYPRMVMHPTVTVLNGASLISREFDRATASYASGGKDHSILQQQNLFVAMNELVQTHGSGFVRYEWPKPLPDGGVSEAFFPKLSYVTEFAPWGWVIGTGIYIDDIDAMYAESLHRQMVKFGLWAFGLALVFWAVLSSVLKPLGTLRNTIETLRKNPEAPVILPVRRQDEVGQLATSFQAMITERQQFRLELLDAMREARLSEHALSAMAEGVVVTDTEPRILSVNPAFTRISGYDPQEAIGKSPSLLRSGRHDRAFYAAMWNSLEKTDRWQGEIWNKAKDGRIYPEWLSIVAARDIEGRLVNYVAVFSDMTERKQSEMKIRYLAEHDTLTGLPNRVLLLDRLQHAIQKAERNQTKVAVLFIDLDRFKNINDSLGHDVGDDWLREVARRIEQAVRQSDTVSRTGGDEFVVLLTDLTSPDDAARAAEAVLQALSEPFVVAEHTLVSGASIGVSFYPDDARDAQHLIQAADTAMYHSKENGRGTFHFFTQEMNTRVFERMSLENRLRIALNLKEFRLYYQPQVDIASGKLIGFEALIRWQHPEMGMVPPAKFIPIAEESGLILQIGRWVLAEACRQMQAWREAGLTGLSVAVNISALQFRDPNFCAEVRHTLDLSGLPPQCLELELTESMMMARVEHSIEVMHELKKNGVQLSLDDFGTGYSSMAYLKRFPIDKIKVDQSFVRGMTQNPQDRAIVQAVVYLADSLSLATIAEGVETLDICAALQTVGCHEIQGYFYGRPEAPETAEQLIRSWSASAVREQLDPARARLTPA